MKPSYFHPALRPRPATLVQELGVWNGEMPDRHGGYVERKHDGWRLIRFDGQCRTRNGMPYRGIRHIERALAFLETFFACPMAFDGEFVVGEGPHTLARTKAHQDKGWKERDAGRLHLFDALPLADWHEGACWTPLYQRKADLEAAYLAMMASPLAWEYGWTEEVECPLVIVESRWAGDAGEVRAMAREVWSEGGEGVVVKSHDAPYRRERNTDWRKLKR
jgi:ATP-dependent DNA ligase